MRKCGGFANDLANLLITVYAEEVIWNTAVKMSDIIKLRVVNNEQRDGTGNDVASFLP